VNRGITLRHSCLLVINSSSSAATLQCEMDSVPTVLKMTFVQGLITKF